MANLAIQEVNKGIVFKAKIVSGSCPPTKVCGLLGEMLKIKVTAAPEKGKANQQLRNFLAKQLGVKQSAISIISGRNSPVKQVKILDISADTLLRKLNLNKQRS